MTIVVTSSSSATPLDGLTFLELCTRTHKECGLSGAGPVGVTAQSGMSAKVVNWVTDAYEEIQTKHPNWHFLWNQYSGELAAQETHNPTNDWSISVRSWDQRDEASYIYLTASGVAGRTFLTWLPWDLYRSLPQGQAAGFPLFVTQAPDRSLRFHPTPSAGYTVVMDFWERPEELTANTDVPKMPAEYQMAIVWRAVMFYAGHDEAGALFQSAKLNFDRLMSRMEDTELDAMGVEGPLA